MERNENEHRRKPGAGRSKLHGKKIVLLEEVALRLTGGQRATTSIPRTKDTRRHNISPATASRHRLSAGNASLAARGRPRSPGMRVRNEEKQTNSAARPRFCAGDSPAAAPILLFHLFSPPPSTNDFLLHISRSPSVSLRFTAIVADKRVHAGLGR